MYYRSANQQMYEEIIEPTCAYFNYNVYNSLITMCVSKYSVR